MARFCSLFSGSSGNSLYIGTPTSGLLVDAGVSAKRLRSALTARGIDPRTLSGILVTHEHNDHIAGLPVFEKTFSVPLYASRGTMRGMETAGVLNSGPPCFCMEAGTEYTVGEFTVLPFHTSHDCLEGFGYRIGLPDGRRVGIAADLGVMTPTVRTALSGCDLIYLESNHDITLLRNGPYPYPLKRRILSERGHLSNAAAAEELPSLVRAGTGRIVLGHLSERNNRPELALSTARAALTAAGFCEQTDYLLIAAPPENTQGFWLF